MCEFCENISTGLPDWDFSPKDEEDSVPSGIAIKIAKIENKNALVFTNSANEYGAGALNINYCPMCDRKLVEE